MSVYYNENNPEKAAWLRQNIAMGIIADGVVDERSIKDIQANELAGFTQCHFFAGIGGWSYAARLAGIPDDYPIWTGSCPCQPFSCSGKQKAQKDDRHLWPYLYRIISQSKPDIFFGEQVADAIRHGWLCGVQADMEAENYTLGAVVLGAHSVGTYHQRQRLYFVAHANNIQWRQQQQFKISNDQRAWDESSRRCKNDLESMEQPQSQRCRETRKCVYQSAQRLGKRCSINHETLADTHGYRLQVIVGTGKKNPVHYKTNPFNYEPIQCTDGYRPIKPGLEPLVNGLPRGVLPSSYRGMAIDANHSAEARAMRLRGYGDAIVPQVAAEFMTACLEELSHGH